MASDVVKALRDAGFGLRKSRSLKGMDGVHWEAEFTYKGKTVAYVGNDGRGGEDRYDPDWAEALAQEALAKLNEVCAALPHRLPYEGAEKEEPVSPKTAVCTLADEDEMEKKLKRKCAKAILYRVDGETPEDAWYEWKVPYTPERAAEVRRHPKFAGKPIIILNETLAK